MPEKTLPLDMLMAEHRVIESVLDSLEVLCQRSEASADAFVADDALAMVDFFRNYADRCHHGKEEDILFGVLESKGMPAGEGPTAQMRHEHDEGRAHVRAMEEAARAVAGGDAAALAAFAEHARGFIHLLREHIVKEDECLFPMADGILDESEMEEMATCFGATANDADHARYEPIAADLARRYARG